MLVTKNKKNINSKKNENMSMCMQVRKEKIISSMPEQPNYCGTHKFYHAYALVINWMIGWFMSHGQDYTKR